MSHDLSRLFRPRHIAVLGGGWADNVVRQCRKMGFAGPVWPVHPTRPTLGGEPCVPSLADLPEAPDATFIGVNRHATLDVVTELSAMGGGGAVCFASGWAEAEDGREAGADLQRRLLDAAGAMPVLGPNCYGLINYLDGAAIWPDQHGGARAERGVAIIGQSSNMLINMTMQRRGLPLAYIIAAGNQAQTGLATMASALLDDERVSAVGLHIEGIGDVRAFEALAAKARARGVPIVALKVGRSAAAQAATISHTASIAGGDAAGRAFLARLGIGVVDTLPTFLETLKLLHVHGPLGGRSVFSVSCSGGEASLIGDAAEGGRIRFDPLPGETRARLSAELGPLVTISNPIDYHTFIWGDRERMTRTFRAATQAGFDLTLFIYDFPRTDRCDEASWVTGLEAMADAAEGAGPTAIVATLPECMPEGHAETLIARGIAPMSGLPEALAAIEASAAIGEAGPPEAPMLLPSGHGAAAVLTEAEAKAALAQRGVPVPDGMVATNPAEAGQAAEALGFPVALKGLGVAHKTEAGAVHLNLLTTAEVETAAAAMTAEGYLIERMVSGTVAELIVGVLRDPVFGYQLTLGAGGVLTELLADSVTLPIPATPGAIETALRRLRIAPLLAGYRGKPAASIPALIGAILAVQDFAAAEAHRLAELDINPLIVTADGAVAADALIRYGPDRQEDGS